MKRTPRLLVLAIFAMSVVMMAGSAMAQPGGGRGGRGGPGGFGGIGGPGGGGVLALMRAEVVRTEVGIDDEMAGKVREVAQKAMESGREAFQGMGNIRDLPEAERQAKFAEMREKMQERTKDLEKQIAEVVGKDKFGRLKQIELQVQGVEALRRPEVVEHLGLADKQEEISTLFDANREKMGEMFRNFRDMSEEERTAAREKMGSLREELQKEVMAVLSAEQKKKLGEMMGEPFAKMDELREQMRAGFGPGDDRGGRGPGRDRGQRGGGERRQRPT